jgi:UDP:flavonoid glycosyltransferase YjiC (YdhE family)/uncharacterized protein (DUF2141 family)
MRKRILFVAESVTLAQVVRLVSLARSLDERAYDVHFACASFPDFIFGGTTFARHALHSIGSDRIEAALRSGRRLYDKRTLRRYVRDDLALFDVVKPDVVIGDFRWSLPVSAPLWGVPHVALANAYWSPHSTRRDFPMPDHPIVKLLGEERAAPHFPKALPYVFAHFARPVNALRKAYRLPPIGSLPHVLTYGDYVLYADTPLLAPTSGAPEHHAYLGPVAWSPAGPAPHFGDFPSSERPLVYVTLGSSGNVAALPIVVEALGTLPLTAIVATAGRARIASPPANVRVTDFVPGDAAARRSRLVISNGGSSTGYQALAEGAPVLGIASNLDQFLAMRGIVAAGAGEVLRASTVTVSRVRASVTEMIATDTYRERARVVQRDIAKWSFASRFREILFRITGAEPPATADESSNGIAKTLGTSLSLVAALLLGAVTAGSAHAEGAPPAGIPVTNEIRFSAPVDGSKGHVICALFRKDGWLKTPVQWKKVDIRNQEAECIFTSVPPDVYGISAFHDENDNEKLDTNFLGIPTESWCTSRDAKAYFGPPSFDDAKFRYTGSVMRQRSSLK